MRRLLPLLILLACDADTSGVQLDAGDPNPALGDACDVEWNCGQDEGLWVDGFGTSVRCYSAQTDSFCDSPGAPAWCEGVCLDFHDPVTPCNGDRVRCAPDGEAGMCINLDTHAGNCGECGNVCGGEDAACFDGGCCNWDEALESCV